MHPAYRQGQSKKDAGLVSLLPPLLLLPLLLLPLLLLLLPLLLLLLPLLPATQSYVALAS